MSRRIICDVDGVCANFVDGIEEVIQRKVYPVQWSFLETDLTKPELELVYAALKRPWFWRELVEIEGARDGVEALRDAGWEVVFATSPWASCRAWWYERVQWLQKHMGAERRDCVAAARKDVIAGSVIIDDRPKHIEDWLDANPTKSALLYDHGYNERAGIRDDTNVDVFTWDKLHELLLV